jgi:hypothetical protein
MRKETVATSLAAVVVVLALFSPAGAAGARQPSPRERAEIAQAVVFLFGYYRGPMTPRIVSIRVSTVAAPAKFALEVFHWVQRGRDAGIARVLFAYSPHAVSSAYPHFGTRSVHWVLEGAQLPGGTPPCPSKRTVAPRVLRDLGLHCP